MKLFLFTLVTIFTGLRALAGTMDIGSAGSTSEVTDPVLKGRVAYYDKMDLFKKSDCRMEITSNVTVNMTLDNRNKFVVAQEEDLTFYFVSVYAKNDYDNNFRIASTEMIRSGTEGAYLRDRIAADLKNKGVCRSVKNTSSTVRKCYNSGTPVGCFLVDNAVSQQLPSNCH